MYRFGENSYNAFSEESSDPLITPLFNRLTPVRDDFNNSYEFFITKNSLRIGLTATMEGKKKSLPKIIEGWEANIIVAYPKDTQDYIQCFPYGKTYIYEGGYETIGSKLRSLHSVLDSKTFPSNPKAAVLTYWTEWAAARSSQLAAMQAVDVASDDIKAKHISYSNMLYRNWGALIDIYYENPDLVNRFFDYSILRSKIKDEVVKKGNVAGGDTNNIFSKDVEDTTNFLVENPGTTRLRYFATDTAAGTISSGGIELNPGESRSVTTLELGNPGNKFINVTNLDADNQGSYKITMF